MVTGLHSRAITWEDLCDLLADGWAMGTGAFLSARSERDVYLRERQRAAELVATEPEKEKEKLDRFAFLRQTPYN